MTNEQSKAEEYLSRAAEIRQLARTTRFPEVRTRLLMMAAGFERLADQVEKWERPSPRPPIEMAYLTDAITSVKQPVTRSVAPIHAFSAASAISRIAAAALG